MKILCTIIFMLPLMALAQSMTDSTNVINPSNQAIIRFTTSYQSMSYVNGDSIRFRGTTTKRLGLVSPLDLPINSATTTALNAKQGTITTGTTAQYFRGDLSLATFPTTTAAFSNSTNKNFVTDAQATVIGNTSGTNTGDNATNSQYSGLVSNANHTGDATGSTALTLATVNSNVGSFGSATQAGTFTVNAKGLITAASNTTIAIPESAVTNLVTDLGLKAPLASPAFTGTATGIGLPVYGQVLGSNVTTTGQALVDAAGLTVALAINATYEFEANLSVSTTAVTTGTQYAINYSVAGGAIEAQINGSLTSTAAKAERISTLNTATTAYLTTSGQTGGIRITGRVTTGANAGNLVVRHLKVTSGTSTIFIGSFLKVTRIL